MVAIRMSQKKKSIRRLCTQLSEKDGTRQGLVFDGVYKLRRNDKQIINITHALLDFYDEEMELAEYCEKNVVILSPDDAR